MGFQDPPSLCVIRVCSFFLPLTAASSGFVRTLTTATPSRPIIFSKSTKPRSFLFTWSIEMP